LTKTAFPVEYAIYYYSGKKYKYMFEKRFFCGIDGFETNSLGLVADGLRILALEDGALIAISNSADSFNIFFFTPNGKFRHKMKFEYRFGQLAGVHSFAGELWLEFHEYITMYEEIYKVIRLHSDGSSSLVFSSARESYSHSLAYHALFSEGKDVFCSLIRHNRLHQYRLGDSLSKVEEINIQEGGKWFLSENHPFCQLGGTLEIYDPCLEIISTVDFDYDIDNLFLGTSTNPGFLALLAADHSQGNTFLIVYINDSGICSVSFIESSVAAMGVSAGKIWLNPCSYDPEQDVGGIAVYDRYAQPVYIHIRGKGASSGFGAFPPPIHRSYKIIPTADSTTLIVEANKALLFDYAGRAIQEIPIPHPDFVAVSPDGAALSVLQLNSPYRPDTQTVYNDAVIDFYAFNSKYDGDKVVDIARFRERES
jgi:hypothetical protein